MKKIYSILFLFILCFSCSSDDKSESSKNFITSFQLYLVDGYVEGDIDQATGEITFDDSVGATLNDLTPIIFYSDNATISPSTNTSLDFSNPVNYTVIAENGDSKDYTVTVDNRPFGSENRILSFSFNVAGQDYNCNINDETNIISLDVEDLDLSAVSPTISISEFASISPNPTIQQNFNEVISYVVTAENGNSTTYEVHIDNRPIGTESEILSFSVNSEGQIYNGLINEQDHTITVNLADIDINALSPNITISEYATITPSEDVVQDFNDEITYIVTAENGDTSTYTVISNKVSIDGIYPRFSLNYIYFTGVKLDVYGDYLDPNAPNAEFVLRDGLIEYHLESVTLLNSNLTQNNTIQYQVSAIIPNNIPTSTNYRLLYRSDTDEFEFGNDIDIMSGGPDNMTFNQTTYSYNDILIINGTNLIPGLVVPSNGSNYIIENSNNYDIQVNSNGTELTWTLDYFQHFPSYYGQSPQEKKIYTLGQNRRVGKAITTIFN